MIYICTFSISIFLVWISDSFKYKNKKLSVFFSVLAVVIVAFLAGVRDYSIGTDTSGYANLIFNYAKASPNIVDFYSRASIWGEGGYLLLNYVVARFTSDPHIYYFILGFIMYGLTLWSLWRYSKLGFSVTLAWACYLFLFYGDTLNAMRQMLACSIAFFAFTYFLDKKYIKYVLLMLLAISCHRSALLSFAPAAVYFILQRRDKKSVKFFIVIGVCIFAFFYEYIAQALMNIGLLPVERYSKYLASGIPFDLNALVLRLPFLVFIYLWYKIYKGKTKEEKVFFDAVLMLVIVDLVFSQMRSIVVWLYRLTLYFGMFRCIAYSRLVYSNNKNNRIALAIILLLYLLVLFVYQVIYQGNNEIYPYTSRILGVY